MTFLRIAIATLLLNLTVHAQPTATATGAWAEQRDRATVVYATINNPSMYDVYVVSAKSDAAKKVELLAKDKPVTSLTVPAYGSLELKRGEAAIRLNDLVRELKVGDELKVTLETDGGASIEIAAVIKATEP